MAREVYYLVQSISKATGDNRNFPGYTEMHIVGKNDNLLFRETPDKWGDCNLLAPYWVEKYGYKRRCDAVRNFTYKNPDIDRPYWETEVSIITAWVRKDGKVFISP